MESEILPDVKRTFEDVPGTAAHGGNPIKILKNGKEKLPSMLAAIETSEKTVELLTLDYWQKDYRIDRKSIGGRNIKDVPSFRLLPNGSLDINRYNSMHSWRKLSEQVKIMIRDVVRRIVKNGSINPAK